MAKHRAKTTFRGKLIGGSTILSVVASIFTFAAPSYAVDDVSLFISEPYVQGSHASSAGVRREDFNSLTSCTGSTAVGTMSRLFTDARAVCSIQNGDSFGGASVGPDVSTPATGGTASKYMTNGYDEVTFNLTASAKYIGLWWSAGNASNTVTFFDNTTQIAQVTAADINTLLTGSGSVSALGGGSYPKSNYWGNPRNTSLAYPEPFAYINLFLSGGFSANKIVISGGGFEMDNLVTSESDETPQESMVYVSSTSGSVPTRQVIAWAPSNTTGEVGAGSLTPNALASVTTPATGGGAISYSIKTAGATGCSVNSTGVISYTSAGTCVVRASAAPVAGTPNYFAATKDVTFTFSVSAPAAPLAPSAVAGDTSATVSVTRANTGGTPVSYLVTAAPGGATCTITAPATECLVTGLTNGTSYTFTATATNGTGTSSSSPVSNAVVPAPPTVNSPSQSSSQPQPPIQPIAIQQVEVRKGAKSNSAVVRVKLKEVQTITNADVKIRIYDFAGNVIKELTVSMQSNADSVELDIPLGFGDFNVDARAVNAAGISSPIKASANIVNKSFFSTSARKLPVLQGSKLGAPVYFAANSTSLSAASKKYLKTLAQKLADSQSRIALTGYSVRWTKGSAVEQSIARIRALNVAKFLKSQGLENWIYYEGFGGVPAGSNDPKNRKVELRVIN